MRRLLRYLRPYWRSVLVALVAILACAALQLVPPWLTRQVIDVYIPAARLSRPAAIVALCISRRSSREFALEFVQTLRRCR